MSADDVDRCLQTISELVVNPGFDQVAYLVPDIYEAIDEWNSILGEQEWKVYLYSPETLPQSGFRGESAQFAMRLALTSTSPQFELIQPIDGPSIYHEWIERRGFGPHHVGRFVTDIEESMSRLRAIGFEPAQWGTGYGLDGDGGFAYYELGEQGETVVELIQPPKRRRQPEAIESPRTTRLTEGSSDAHVQRTDGAGAPRLAGKPERAA